ncbi:MAG: hypothetical protein QGI24_06840 [Kiritimatiellia bacterium]|nr:hypothetical protein [Kiritimatiellia bacterium]MDP6848489.1 hypothetical protein [Kiritimatiellia bacterium]
MKNRAGMLSVLLVTFLLAVTAMGVTVYETVSPSGNKSGAWDVNILADDVHFRCGGIITNVVMSLAIRGTNSCRVWIFDGFLRDAIYSAPFTHVPSSSSLDFQEYSFPMRVSVPKDIYIGFSAEGDGWGGSNLTDHAENDSTVASGIATNAGIYWWGAVAGGQLNQGANFGSGDYFNLNVQMLQPEITDVVVTNGTASHYQYLRARNVYC